MCCPDTPYPVGMCATLGNEYAILLHELLVMSCEKIPVGTACFVDGKSQVG